MTDIRNNERTPTDTLLEEIADYVLSSEAASESATDIARYCLMDSLGCGFLALQFPACTKMLGPVVPGAGMADGGVVPGTKHRLDPVAAAFNIGCMIRWLDYNDTWLAEEWGHPSDNLGAILACADYQSRVQGETVTVADILQAMIKAHEIQGVLALNHAFNRVGLDHVLLVRIASTAVATAMLGGDRDQVVNALSHAWMDGGALRTYRHAPNTGSRKSWAAGDATSRAVRLALISLTGEMGAATALTAEKWGFQDVLYRSRPMTLARPLGNYVMENVLFKISFPAEFHAQTAVEAAIALHPDVRDRIDDISLIELTTQESAVRIIDKTGPLHNPADRDHCLQYMVAIGLLFGKLEAEDYEDDVAADPRVDRLRSLMQVKEDPRFTRDYLDAEKRSIANAVQVTFSNGERTEEISVEYPVGHRRRRDEGIPLLVSKFRSNLATRFSGARCEAIAQLCGDMEQLQKTPAREFMDLIADSDA